MPARLKEHYEKQVVAKLQSTLGYTNKMAVPKIEKITLNIGIGSGDDKKVLQAALSDLYQITGQLPVVTKAKKSIAGFKVRKDWPIGVKVTLRKATMYEFLDRLISITIPRIRDFRGFTCRSLDGRGNMNIGFKEQIVFPEIAYDQIDALRGLNITITTSAKSDYEAYHLLSQFKFPYREKVYPSQLLKKTKSKWLEHSLKLESSQEKAS